jgi:hypothetical protein
MLDTVITRSRDRDWKNTFDPERGAIMSGCSAGIFRRLSRSSRRPGITEPFMDASKDVIEMRKQLSSGCSNAYLEGNGALISMSTLQVFAIKSPSTTTLLQSGEPSQIALVGRRRVPPSSRLALILTCGASTLQMTGPHRGTLLGHFYIAPRLRSSPVVTIAASSSPKPQHAGTRMNTGLERDERCCVMLHRPHPVSPNAGS